MDVAKAAILISQFGRIDAGTAPVAFGVSAVPAISASARTRFLA
jgi:hypothetical protein